MSAALASYGAAPIYSLGESVAEWCLDVLIPRLCLSILCLSISLVRFTKRYPIKVYVGADPIIRKMVKRCPSFNKDYRPPTWAVGAWAQAVIYLYRSWRNSHLLGYQREEIILPDGELVSLQLMAPRGKLADVMHNRSEEWTAAQALAEEITPETPIVIICHGVFQSAADLHEFCTFLTNTCGFVACVFNRRGNDFPLSRARFNTVGDQQDFRFILGQLREWFPNNAFFGVGISAGSSLLARYLGDSGTECELEGGVIISGGFDMEQSLQHMTPLADMVVTSHAKKFYLERNQETLASENHTGLLQLQRSRSMHEFHQHMHVFDGKASREEYFETHNPALVLENIAVPTVYINAYDDMCFPGHFTFQYKHLVERCQTATILHVPKGGHGTFYENWDAGTSRAWAVVREFVTTLNE